MGNFNQPFIPREPQIWVFQCERHKKAKRTFLDMLNVFVYLTQCGFVFLNLHSYFSNDWFHWFLDTPAFSSYPGSHTYCHNLSCCSGDTYRISRNGKQRKKLKPIMCLLLAGAPKPKRHVLIRMRGVCDVCANVEQVSRHPQTTDARWRWRGRKYLLHCCF